jgi:hypothetical protein
VYLLTDTGIGYRLLADLPASTSSG